MTISPIQRFPGAEPRSGNGALRRGVMLALAPLALCIAGALHAQSAPAYTSYTQNDFGGIGLLQTPSARMADEGEVSFVYNRVYPYTRLNVGVQPFSWLEATFRYTIISDRAYPADTSAHPQRDLEKDIDLKLHLHEETRFLPAVAVGLREFAGNGPFSSEYFVASKRAGPLDFSLGLGWGNLGARGDLPNPFGWIDSSFNNRPVPTIANSNAAGGLDLDTYFRGRTALFGGFEYQTPMNWLRLKVELDGNNYKHEAFDGIANNQPQRSPINLGALFRVTHNVDVTLGYERGNTVMATVSLHGNLAQKTEAPKPLEPVPEPIATRPASDSASAAVSSTSSATSDPLIGSATQGHAPQAATTDWAAVSRILEDNAGISVNRIVRRRSELLVYGERKKYFYTPQGLGRAARLLNNRLDASIDWITVVSEQHGMPIVEFSVHRPQFVQLLDNEIDLAAFKRSVELDSPASEPQTVLYSQPFKKWDFGLAPGYAQALGSPNAPVIYQVTADASASYRFRPDLWLDAQVDVNLLNNFKIWTYDPPSLLPRVRTDVREYLESSNVVMPNFQLTGTRVLGTDLFGMAYAGMLESMFGGIGGEVLYRPLGQRWAVGMDANFVRQRGFDQDFSFRNYQVVTGLATLYMDSGFQGLNTSISAGRYLAGDWGTTVDVSRHFDNGVRIGAYATLTTAGKKYGEGSFDKGVYLSVPFDLFTPWSKNQLSTFQFEPLVRDGGARLNKTYNLYDMTEDRNTDLFYENFNTITH